jgi:hypothetical protein
MIPEHDLSMLGISVCATTPKALPCGQIREEAEALTPCEPAKPYGQPLVTENHPMQVSIAV